MKKFINFYINSSINVAISVLSLVKVTDIYFNINTNWNLLSFIFFATIVSYNFVKYSVITKLYYRSITKNLKIIILFSIICFFFLIIYTFFLNLKTIFLLLPFGIITILYAVPFIGKSNLRNIPSLKILIISLVWTIVTVIIPITNSEITFDFKTFLITLQRLLFIIVLTLPFDIRDFSLDKKKLKTIPQLIGVKKTKKLGFLILLITLFLEFFITKNINLILSFLIIFFIMLFFLQRSSINQKKYYSSFWVEAIPIYWLLILFFINKF